MTLCNRLDESWGRLFKLFTLDRMVSEYEELSRGLKK